LPWDVLAVPLVLVVVLAAWAQQAARSAAVATPRTGDEQAAAGAAPALRLAADAQAPVADAEYLPMVRVAPVYPAAAEQQRIEGRCTVEYTIAATGAVRDVRARACTPAGVFEQAAVEAARQFKYRPRVRAGRPVEVSGVRNEFQFALAQ
jgi:TonB family protein